MPMTCDTPFRCRETPHSDVLNQNTAPATNVMSQDIGMGWTCNLQVRSSFLWGRVGVRVSVCR